jgi:hypothetical protein
MSSGSHAWPSRGNRPLIDDTSAEAVVVDIQKPHECDFSWTELKCEFRQLGPAWESLDGVV